jgi:SAM-dependent methyltransferase
VRQILDRIPAGNALDAACGTGRHAGYLAALGHQVTGVDSSPDMLARARQRVPAARFLAGDLHQLPIRVEAVDLVVCALALTHVPALDPVMAWRRPTGTPVVQRRSRRRLHRYAGGDHLALPANRPLIPRSCSATGAVTFLASTSGRFGRRRKRQKQYSRCPEIWGRVLAEGDRAGQDAVDHEGQSAFRHFGWQHEFMPHSASGKCDRVLVWGEASAVTRGSCHFADIALCESKRTDLYPERPLEPCDDSALVQQQDHAGVVPAVVRYVRRHAERRTFTLAGHRCLVYAGPRPTRRLSLWLPALERPGYLTRRSGIAPPLLGDPAFLSFRLPVVPP